MSKSDKLLAKLFATPPPKGFSWNDLLTVMARAGFKNHCDSGSHFTFEHLTGLRVGISKTHPSGILKPYQVKAAKEALEIVGKSLEKRNDSK